MALQLPRDLRPSEAFQDVEAFIRSIQDPGLGLIVDATDPASQPGGTLVAFTAWRRSATGTPLSPSVAVVDTVSADVRLLGEDGQPGSQRRPSWSPDGERLLCLQRESDGTEHAVLIELSDGSAVPVAAPAVQGTVEAALWAPDGSAVALLVAEVGAEISDVFGSGRIAGHDQVPDWCPEVATEGRSGWRRLWLAHPGRDDVRLLAPTLNVWEVAWAGPSHAVAIASRSAEEDAWYDAELVLVATGDGSSVTLLAPTTQLAVPASDPSGRWVTVLTGTASDRGLVAGQVLMIDTAEGQVVDVRADDVHVTSQFWQDENRLLLAGMRGHQTVVGTYDVRLGRFTETWSTDETFGPGELLPVAAPYGTGDALVVLESHRRPPALGLVRDGAFEPLLDLAHAGTALLQPVCPTLQPVSWLSTDGLRIDGYRATPQRGGPGPYPMVVLIHGGPVWRWRDTWTERTIHVPLLLRQGFAVLLPNPRGSQGRGETFVRNIVGEIGGLDVDDVLGGVDQAVADGVARPSSVGVMGSSYGGFLAAWLATTGRFAAAFATSPVTDWVSQHHTTNIPQSDERFLDGHPLDPSSQYWTRSPIAAASQHTCPVLLTAGQLDLATPPGQALEMYRALVELGVEADLALYPREGHDVHEWPAMVDHSTRMLLWFERHLQEPGAGGAPKQES